MSILFFNLRGVPADEADDVRQLLQENNIDFYETSAGMLGISLPAIWLHHQDDMPTAQRLFESYQQQRAGRHATGLVSTSQVTKQTHGFLAT